MTMTEIVDRISFLLGIPANENTEELDITELKRVLKAHSLKFYSAYLFLVMRAISEIEELRIGYRDNTLGIWSRLTPL